MRSGPGATRTRDLLLRRQALYPTELRTRIVGGSWPPGPLFATTVEWARRRVPAERVRERATSCSGGKRSIQLSYGPELWGEVGRLGHSLQPRWSGPGGSISGLSGTILRLSRSTL